jgi:uncharacterized protein
MAIHFLDSSALVKRYISEIGTVWVSGLFDPVLGHEVFVAAVAGVEIVAAVTRRARGGSISTTDATTVCSQLRSDLEAEYQILELQRTLLILG